MSYQQVEKELAKGTAPELLCMTCPWDRLCITPPTVTRADIERQIEEAKQQDEALDPERKKAPMGMLLTAITMGGRDQMGTLCPVFALRLRSPDGRRLMDTVRQTMQGWTEGGDGS